MSIILPPPPREKTSPEQEGQWRELLWQKVNEISTDLDTAEASIVALQPVGGRWTPTLTNVTNLDASTAYSCHYVRVKNTVCCFGRVDIDITIAGNLTELGVSLPIASDFTSIEDCHGVGTCASDSTRFYAIADITNNRAQLQIISANTSNMNCNFGFMYEVK
jgi:hypothetical protein